MRGAEEPMPANGPARTGEPVRALVEALVEHDFEGVAAAFAPEAAFRALLPREQVDARGAGEAAAWFLTWFGDAQALSVCGLDAAALGQVTTFRFHLRARKPRGWSEIVQAGVCESSGGAITSMRLACSGFQYQTGDGASPAASPEQRFDAGDLGCGSGLPAAFRERIGGVSVGQVLRVIARDPSAREDLPAMARMLGHRVLSVESGKDGEIVIEVERGR